MARVGTDGGQLVPAVDRAVDVLELLARQPGLTMTEIRRHLGLPKSSTFGLLRTLEHRNMVDRSPDTGRYRLGLNLLYLGGTMRARTDVRHMALDTMRQLVVDTQETCHLAVWDRRTMEIMYIEKLESPHWIRLDSFVGHRNPAYCTAVGKVLLAHLDPAALDRYLTTQPLVRCTPRTLTDPVQLRTTLHQVRLQGYAVDDEEHQQGVRCVAAPVRDADRQAVAAVSVSGLAMRMGDDKLPTLAGQVITAANEISRRLGAAGAFGR